MTPDEVKVHVLCVRTHLRTVQTAIGGLLGAMQYYDEARKELADAITSEFPGVTTDKLFMDPWPWDTERLQSSLVDGDPEDYPPGLFVRGPGYSYLDLNLDRFFYPEWHARRGQDLPKVDYTARQLEKRCRELERLTGIRIVCNME